MASEQLVVELVASGFEPTLQRLRAGIDSAGMRVFAEIDHAAAALGVGLHMPPTVLILYGNPKAGTPVMIASQAAALELPLRALLSEGTDGSVRLFYHPIAPALERLGVESQLAARLAGGQRLLLEALHP